MNKIRSQGWLLVVVAFSLLVVAGRLLAAGTVPAESTAARHGAALLRASRAELTKVAGDKVDGQTAVGGPQRASTCEQIVLNPQLNVTELGAGSGTAEPWFFLDPIIYYFKEGDGSDLAYDGYSLVLPDGDEDDPTPKSDILSQILFFPADLESATVAYQRAMLDANPGDSAYGELWLLTEEGDIDLSKPAQYRVTQWPISDSKDVWAKETIQLDPAVLKKLDDKEIALLMRTVTSGGGASAAEMEWVLLDDITVTACVPNKDLYLPVISGN
jgi:hypothetical protein